MKPQPDPIESLRDLFLESAASIFEELSLDAKRRLADGGMMGTMKTQIGISPAR